MTAWTGGEVNSQSEPTGGVCVCVQEHTGEHTGRYQARGLVHWSPNQPGIPGSMMSCIQRVGTVRGFGPPSNLRFLLCGSSSASSVPSPGTTSLITHHLGEGQCFQGSLPKWFWGSPRISQHFPKSQQQLCQHTAQVAWALPQLPPPYPRVHFQANCFPSSPSLQSGTMS